VHDFELVRNLLSDERLARTHPDPENAARVSDSALLGVPAGDYEAEFAEHARARAILLPQFSPKRMRSLRPRIEALTGQVLDRLARESPPADLVAAVATPLPGLVICELLGAPAADRERLQAWTRAVGAGTDEARSAQGLAELFEYGQALVSRKRREPGDDVISRLCADESLQDAEIAGYAMRLLFAGYETMVMQIGQGALSLLASPGEWQALAGELSLIDSAVEEVLRASGTSGGGIPRYARTGLMIGGVHIQAGELVLLDIIAANHDPAAFERPELFDIRRVPGKHLTFGHGSTYCLGAPLARVELQVVFRELASRFPAMRLAAEVAKLRFHTDQLTGALVELPVDW